MSLQVYKFGGASVKDAAGIRNLADIIEQNKDLNLLIIVSAMGKTTNALEQLCYAYSKGDDTSAIFKSVKDYHEEILNQLFEPDHPVFDEVANTFVEIDWIVDEEPHDEEDFIYDQIVSVGELVSTRIVNSYLQLKGLNSQWLDARSYIHTGNTYREGDVDWTKSAETIQQQLSPILEKKIGVSQGFIGGTSENYTTTLGREGSDYSAAIFASCLKAEALTIWKDVPGVLSADPKFFPQAKKYDELSYAEALEMTYYGATVIHPKTIKPLQNWAIPLYVKPFYQPGELGTRIGDRIGTVELHPAVIIKNDQALLSLSSKDFSFITEEHLSEIFDAFASTRIKVNMMQMSAISFSVCIDFHEKRFGMLVKKLDQKYALKYNTGLKLITIRHYKKELIDELTEGKTLLLEQLSRNTAQLIIKDIN